MQAVKAYSYGDPNGSPLICCNGICNNKDGTEYEASNYANFVAAIERVYSHCAITVFNIAVTLEQYETWDTGQAQRDEEMGKQYAELIKAKTALKLKVKLIAFSYGALITKLALSSINEQTRQQIDVESFGGIVAIPRALAGNVTSYVNIRDMICRGANNYFDDGRVEGMIKIMQVKKRDSLKSLEGAVRQLCVEESWIRNDKPNDPKSLRGHLWMGDKSKVDALIKPELEKYMPLITDYNIELLDSGPLPGQTNLEGEEMTDQGREHIATCGPQVNLAYHDMASHFKALGRIKEEETATVK